MKLKLIALIAIVGFVLLVTGCVQTPVPVPGFDEGVLGEVPFDGAGPIGVLADPVSANFSMTKPARGSRGWGTKYNANLDTLDTAVGTSITSAGIFHDVDLQDTVEPFLTIQNTTEEDIEGGRESSISFKGEQSGAEVTTLAKIYVAHDGIADDEKGDFIVQTNDGTDGDAPTERLRIDSSGLATFSGTVASAVGFDADGAVDIDIGSADVTLITLTTDNTGDAEVALPDDSIGDAEIDWAGLTTSADFTVTGTSFATVGFDVVGAVDMDYGSVDVLDHTFLTAAGGDTAFVVPADSIGDAEIDWSGLTTSADFTVTGTLIATVGIDTVGAADMDYGSIDVLDHTFLTAGTGDTAFVVPNDSIGTDELNWAALNSTSLADTAALLYEAELDSFALLQAQIADKTMINEEDAITLDNALTVTGVVNTTVGLDAVGAVNMDYGSADVPDHTFTTAGTGDTAFVVPNDSIGDAEIDWSGLTTSADFTVTGTSFATVGFDVVGAVDMDYGSADVTDHTFTASGTGDAVFVVPADSIGPSEIDSTTGVYDFGAVTSLEIPNAADPAVTVEGQIAYDTDDDAFEVFDGTASRLVPTLVAYDIWIQDPELETADEIAIFHADADMFPHGFKLVNVQFTLNADAAYTLVFEEWAGDPPAATNDIESVTTGAADSYMEILTTGIDDSDIAADAYIYLHFPATDIDWIHVKIIGYAKPGA